MRNYGYKEKNPTAFFIALAGVLIFTLCINVCTTGSGGSTSYKSREERQREKKQKEDDEYNRALWDAARKIDGY